MPFSASSFAPSSDNVRPLALAERDLARERRAMLALDVVVEVGRGEQDAAATAQHGARNNTLCEFEASPRRHRPTRGSDKSDAMDAPIPPYSAGV